MKGHHRVEITHDGETYYVGTFKHSRVARAVEQNALAVLKSRRKKRLDDFAELMDRYVKNRTDESGDTGAQVA